MYWSTLDRLNIAAAGTGSLAMICDLIRWSGQRREPTIKEFSSLGYSGAGENGVRGIIEIAALHCHFYAVMPARSYRIVSNNFIHDHDGIVDIAALDQAIIDLALARVKSRDVRQGAISVLEIFERFWAGVLRSEVPGC